MDSHLPTSIGLQLFGTGFAAAGTIAGAWWLTHNNFSTLEVKYGFIFAFMLAIVVVILLLAISHAQTEKNYGRDPLKRLTLKRTTPFGRPPF
jgi:hypothetical protein